MFLFLIGGRAYGNIGRRGPETIHSSGRCAHNEGSQNNEAQRIDSGDPSSVARCFYSECVNDQEVYRGTYRKTIH